MSVSDAQLAFTVRAAAAGDERAWNSLVRMFTPMLKRIARGYRLAPDDVDDVVQACWLSLLTHVHSLREPAAIPGWLATTARRKSLRAKQGVIREILTDSPVDLDTPGADGVESPILEAERAAVLRDAVRRLPGRQRVLIETIIDKPDRSYAEVSEQLGMPIGSIGPTRERGLSRLRDDEHLSLVATP